MPSVRQTDEDRTVSVHINASRFAAALLFIPVSLLVYHLGSTTVGALAEPHIASTTEIVIIDHFHIELYVEALFLAVCLAVRARRAVVWIVGGLLVPHLPLLFFAFEDAGARSLAGRSPLQDAVLWSLEGLAGGALACGVWELASGALRRIQPPGQRPDDPLRR